MSRVGSNKIPKNSRADTLRRAILALGADARDVGTVHTIREAYGLKDGVVDKAWCATLAAILALPTDRAARLHPAEVAILWDRNLTSARSHFPKLRIAQPDGFSSLTPPGSSRSEFRYKREPARAYWQLQGEASRDRRSAISYKVQNALRSGHQAGFAEVNAALTTTFTGMAVLPLRWLVSGEGEIVDSAMLPITDVNKLIDLLSCGYSVKEYPLATALTEQRWKSSFDARQSWVEMFAALLAWWGSVPEKRAAQIRDYERDADLKKRPATTSASERIRS